ITGRGAISSRRIILSAQSRNILFPQSRNVPIGHDLRTPPFPRLRTCSERRGAVKGAAKRTLASTVLDNERAATPNAPFFEGFARMSPLCMGSFHSVDYTCFVNT